MWAPACHSISGVSDLKSWMERKYTWHPLVFKIKHLMRFKSQFATVWQSQFATVWQQSKTNWVPRCINDFKFLFLLRIIWTGDALILKLCGQSTESKEEKMKNKNFTRWCWIFFCVQADSSCNTNSNATCCCPQQSANKPLKTWSKLILTNRSVLLFPGK